MARYEHLPIYKQALDVAVHFEKVVAGFSRYHKYTLGSELRNQSRGVVAAVVKANAARDKSAQLLMLRERPRLVPIEHGRCTLYREDAGYESLNFNAPGPRHRLVMKAGDWRYIREF